MLRVVARVVGHITQASATGACSQQFVVRGAQGAQVAARHVCNKVNNVSASSKHLVQRQATVKHGGSVNFVWNQAKQFLRGDVRATGSGKRHHGTIASPQPAAEAAAQVGGAAITTGIPDGARKQLTAWLAVCSGWVFSLVVLGGITRLTRSGLSMTDWKFTGERPPLNAADWELEFAKYRASPEFKKLNAKMTVDEFKFIYWMEYGHRMWARALGLVFALPAAYFAARGFIQRPLAGRLALLFLMGGTQGLVGWWMVRSGLQESSNTHDVPRVSPYRLATHLTSAFAIYATLVWTTLTLASPTSAAMSAPSAQVAGALALRSRLLPLAGLIGVTAISGAYVAGLDAGHAYNTFPLMNGQLIPDEYFSVPGWRNAFESTAAVQLHHRALALSTLAAVSATWWWSRSLALPRSSRLLMHALAGVTCAQVALGITTLLTYVPVSLGTAHQAGAMTVFTVVLSLLHTLRPQARLSPKAAMLVAPGTIAAVVGLGGMATQMT